MSAWNDELDNKMTVQQCLFCHSYAPGYIAKQYEFGTLMHAVHYNTRNKAEFANDYQGDCMSCHNATENGEGPVSYTHLDVYKRQTSSIMPQPEYSEMSFPCQCREKSNWVP